MKCDEINTIPQFSGTCWFNAILMATLYSENARKVLLKVSKTWDKNNSLFKIFKIILKRNYKNKLINDFFHVNKPDLILYKIIKTFDPELKSIFKKKLIKNIASFGFRFEYIIKFLKFLNVNCLDILYTSKDEIYLNTDSILNYKDVNDIIEYNINIPDIINKNPNTFIQETKNILNNIPDIIVLTHYELFKLSSKFKENIIKSLNKYNYAKHFNAKTFKNEFNININDLNNYKDKIVLNGHTYILDSCIISQLGQTEISHAIAGITCNNERYVYNGWSKTSTDPAMKNKGQDILIDTPCSLMKFKWDLNTFTPFCLNTNFCKLDFDFFNFNNYNFCFSFGAGERLLIYVRSDLKNDSISKSSSSINNNSNDIKEFINELFDIKNMKIEDIKNNLIYNFNIPSSDIENKSKKELQKILYDKLYKLYRTKHLDKKKKLIKVVKNNCPKPRKPINGKCNDTFPFLKINKKGYQCCYKKLTNK